MAKNDSNGGLFHGGAGYSKGGDDTRTSAPQNTAVGSGSRPTRSKLEIADSSPTDAKISERSVPGALK